MIDFYRIRSTLTQITEEKMGEYISQLEHELGEKLNLVDIDRYCEDRFALLYVASGGSEAYFLQVFDRIKDRPCYILTSGDSNSLAASMEILSYLNTHGGSGEIIHGNVSKVAERIRALRNNAAVREKLSGKNYGCIGKPSDWLIASSFSPERVKEKLGMGFVSVDIQELIDETNKKEYEENEYTALLKTKDFDAQEVERALWVYGGIKRLCNKYDLSAVTVRCFDLLDTVHTTGCLALAILNAEGIYAGCEGDVPSLLSMAVLGSVTGQPCFLCNPSRFDTKEMTAVFAHCTIPVNMLKQFTLNTHFESGIGVAIQGTFEEVPCTVFKCSGDLSRFHAQEGMIIAHEYSDMLCRTQIELKLDDFSYFMTNPINNHHIICLGHHAKAVQDYFNSL